MGEFLWLPSCHAYGLRTQSSRFEPCRLFSTGRLVLKQIAKRATVFSAYASSIFIGVGLSFLIGGTVAQSYDWRVSLQVLGWGSLALVGLGLFFHLINHIYLNLSVKEPSRDLESPQDSGLLKSWSDLKELLSKPALRYHLVGFSLLAMSGYTLLAFVGSIFRTAYGRSDLVPTYGWFLFGTALAVSLAGWITDRWAKRYGARNRLNWGWVSGLGALHKHMTRLRFAYLLSRMGLLGHRPRQHNRLFLQWSSSGYYSIFCPGSSAWDGRSSVLICCEYRGVRSRTSLSRLA